MGTNLKTRKVLGATTNYENLNITAASKKLANDLSKDEKDLKVALINTDPDSSASSLVTASILEEMVNAETDLTFLDQRDTGKHDTELKKALRSDENQKVPLDLTAKAFSESTGASAVLIIYQSLEGHFDLELMELPSLDTLAIGQSDDRPFEISINAQPTAKVFIEMPDGEYEELGDTSKILYREAIKKFQVTTNTKFKLEHNGTSRTYIHRDKATLSEEWVLKDESESKDGSTKIYHNTTDKDTVLVVEDKGDKIKYSYTWWYTNSDNKSHIK